MYIGSTGSKGLHHLVWEIVDNAVDEIQGGHATTVDVTMDCDTNTVTVRDNGRGIPTDLHPATGTSALETVLTVLHAGGKFGSGSYAVSGGLHGVGLSVVNALSEQLDVRPAPRRTAQRPRTALRIRARQAWRAHLLRTSAPALRYCLACTEETPPNLQVTVWRGSSEFHQEFCLGRPTAPLAERPLSNGARRGTHIAFRYDPSVFSADAAYEPDIVAKRLRELAFLNASATLNLTRIQKGEAKEETFRYAGGIAEYVRQLTEGSETLHDVIQFARQSDACDVRATAARPGAPALDDDSCLCERVGRAGGSSRLPAHFVHQWCHHVGPVSQAAWHCRWRWHCNGQTRAQRRSSASSTASVQSTAERTLMAPSRQSRAF
jgi:DNA gyrase subunit B